MESWLKIEGDDASGAEREALREWLLQEDELRGRVHDAPSAPVDGEMGTAADVLAIAVGSGGALSVLASALVTLAKQPRRARLRVATVTPDGRPVHLDIENMLPGDVAEVLRSTLHSTE